ncbi:MAG: flagellar biosynthetic protein FliO [Parachlamydiaceae bacterium]|nr:MAG: flagellar biosynthetic protein FliO [Parachlamydiaceae bacterium]
MVSQKMMNTRMEQLNTTSEIKIIEKRLLTPKTSLYLIDIHGTGFILAESLNGVTSLGSFNVNEMENSNGQEPFNKLMENRKENRPNV